MTQRDRIHRLEQAERDLERLEREYGELEAERDQLREALVAAVNYVPDLRDVPGIQAALKATEAS